MAYELTIDKLYPEGERYTGAAERFEAYLTGISGFRVDDFIPTIVRWFPPEGADKLIRVRVWVDISPFWTDLYKVEVIAYGSPIYWSAIAVALGALALLTLLSWNVKSIDWEAAKLPLTSVGIGLALLALALILGKPKRGKE